MILPSSLPSLASAIVAATDARLRGQTFESWDYSYRPAQLSDAPEGGERAYITDFSDVRGDEVPTFFQVPETIWGDYVGSDYGRSNWRSLQRDYPDTFVDVYDAMGARWLMIGADVLAAQDDPSDLVNLFSGLAEQYPIYDENDHSELEMELADEAWDAYVKWDLPRSLRDAGLSDDVVDAIDESDLRERFYSFVSDTPQPYYCETSTSIVFPYWDDVVSSLVEHYSA